MKKLLTSLAILALVASTQAATMTWSVSGIKQPSDSSVNGTSGWLAYLFSSDTSSVDSITTALKKSDLSVLSSAFDTTTTSGASLRKTGVLKDAENNKEFSPGDTFGGFAIILDATATDKAQNFLVATGNSVTVNDAGANITLRLASQNWSAMQSTTPTIPEPATGALALAGIALLFRRRK